MSLSNENNTRMVCIPLGSLAAGASNTLPGYSPVGKDRVKSVKLINENAVTANDTNNRVVALRKKGGNDVATLTTNVAGGGLVANEGKSLVLSSAEADLLLADGDNLEVDLSINGSGAALDSAILQLELID